MPLWSLRHAAIVSAGYSPALGFVHTGKMLCFVYDIADLYKCEITIPAAFSAAAESAQGLESRVRHRCRDAFRDSRLLQRIIPDIEHALGAAKSGVEPDFDADAAAPGWLWDYERGGVRGGVNRADDAAPSDIDKSAPPIDGTSRRRR